MPAQSTSEPKSSDESAASVSLEDSEAYGMVFGEYHASTDADPNALEKQPTRVSVHSPAAFPDGGREAWMCTAGAFFCQFCSFGWINCGGIFQSHYQENQLKAYTPSTVAWISSLMVFFMLFGGTFIGKQFDAHGPRVLLLVGTFLHVFGIMMMSISTKYWHFLLAQGVCSSIGASIIFYCGISSVSTWFLKRRAFALGIMSAGSSVGGVIFPVMIPRLIQSVGFGWAIRSTGFLILGTMIFANLTLRSRIPPKGYTPLVVSDFTRHFKEFTFSLVVLSSFFFFLGMFIPINFLPSYALSRGMSLPLSNYIVSIFNGASIIGRLLTGYYGDKIGVFNMVVMITALTGVVVLALWVPAQHNAMIYVFSVMYGASTGAFISISPAIMAHISDIREIGLRNGAEYMVISFAALAGSPIGGALLTATGGYLAMQLFAGVALFVGCAGFVCVRWRLAGWKVLEKV